MRAVLVAIALAVAAPACAAEFPEIDADAWCARASPSPACIRAQQSSYDYARAVWRRLSPSSQDKCFALMRKPFNREFSAGPDYRVLAACIDTQASLDRIEKDRVSPPRFRP